MFRKIALGLLAIAGCSASADAAKTPNVDRIEPPYWWVGMKNDTLQLMVEGPDIAASQVSVNYSGVTLAESVNLDSPNYKLLYLVIAPETAPGEVELSFKQDGRTKTVPYELKKRKMAGEDHKGFTSSDVLYLLMPDRFAQGKKADKKVNEGLEYVVENNRENPNARHGGDIKGIENHLDYLDELGVTAIWACPVLENDMPGGSYHGYATTDYYRIDPRFGTNQEWNEMIDAAHAKGMKVVMDMIFNHSGSNHRWMKDMPSKDWYNHPEMDVMTNHRLSTAYDPYASDYDYDHMVNGWFVPGMPDLNQRNPHLMKYLTQNSIWWIESSGIDGIRMDTYPYADLDGMAYWNERVLEEYPNFNLVGECWYAQEDGSAFWQRNSKINDKNTALPTVMDFKFIMEGRDMFNEETDPWNTGLQKLYNHLSHDYLFPDPKNILTFLDNHDSDRFLAEEPEDLGSWKQATAWLLTSRGIPQIYYGTELLMNGSKEKSDGYIRLDMPGGFPGDKVNAFEASGRTDKQNEAFDWLSMILNWRKGEANEVVANGSLKHFLPQNSLYVYERKLGDKQVVVIMNGTSESAERTMERYAEILPVGTQWTDLISGSPVTVEETMTFAPRQVMILQNF